MRLSEPWSPQCSQCPSGHRTYNYLVGRHDGQMRFGRHFCMDPGRVGQGPSHHMARVACKRKAPGGSTLHLPPPPSLPANAVLCLFYNHRGVEAARREVRSGTAHSDIRTLLPQGNKAKQGGAVL